MKEVTSQTFIANVEKLLADVFENDEFLKIRTKYGNAVLISEDEWNILTDALRVVLSSV